jgi:choline/ethanolamine kinase
MALHDDYSGSTSVSEGGVVVDPFLAAVAVLDREKQKLQASIVSTLATSVPGWADVVVDDVTVDHVGGAMTNLFFIVTKPSDNNPGVLVRIYGQGTESFFSREEETRLFELLSQKKIGVQLLGQFPNGRAEKIIDGTTLTAKQIRSPDISRRIARKMREFHALEIDIDHEPTHMTGIRKLLAVARVKCAVGDKFKGVDFDQIAKDVEELEMLLEEVPSPVVLSHNDLQYGNIMKTETGDVVFIDFEYTSYNNRGYDLGNHFCEWAYDYHKTINSHLGDFKRYPTVEQQREFCRAYLAGGSTDEDGTTVTDEEVEVLRREANVYSLASHMFWGLWGFIQASQSTIDFDFLAYGQCRYAAFKSRVTVS